MATLVKKSEEAVPVPNALNEAGNIRTQSQARTLSEKKITGQYPLKASV
jgi:hypothetical protein